MAPGDPYPQAFRRATRAAAPMPQPWAPYSSCENLDSVMTLIVPKSPETATRHRQPGLATGLPNLAAEGVKCLREGHPCGRVWRCAQWRGR